MRYVFIDFETRSNANLKIVGPEAYARDPSTRPLIICIDGDCYTDFDCDLLTWLDLHHDVTIVAHNAPFERAIMRNCLPHWKFPDRWLDTAAMCRRVGLPASLDEATKAIGTAHTKDKRGAQLIKLFSLPQKDGRFIEPSERPAEFAEFIEYCRKDVAAEKALFDYIGPEVMPPPEIRAMVRNWDSNERGIVVDTEIVDSALQIIAGEERRANALIQEITDGQITTVNQSVKIAQFCGMESIAAEKLKDALDNPEIDADAAAILRTRADVGRASVKKLIKLAARTTPDNRTRNLTIYHGAHTGRETGEGVQLLNMARGRFAGQYAALCECLELIRAGDVEALRARYGSVVGAISSAIRGMFLGDFSCADMASIEARLVFWFADEYATLQLYREKADLYKTLAATIYNKPVEMVTKLEREIGKRGILGLGYGMGADKFVKTVKTNANLDIPLSLAEKAKATYRAKYAGVPRLWRGVEWAAKSCVATGNPFAFGRVSYHMWRDWLICTLPSGRDLYYYRPKIVDGELTYRCMEQRKWIRKKTYGGALTENIVQATARDLLQHFLAEMESRGARIVLTIYDEILAERTDLNTMVDIMRMPPEWCADLPLDAEGWEGERYRK